MLYEDIFANFDGFTSNLQLQGKGERRCFLPLNQLKQIESIIGMILVLQGYIS